VTNARTLSGKASRPSVRFLALGICLVLLAPLGALGLLSWGASSHPASGPGTPALEVTATDSDILCAVDYDPSTPPCNAGGGQLQSSEPYYDTTTHATVVVGTPGVLFLYRGLLGAPINVTLPACTPEWVFPASGSEVTVACYGSTSNASVAFLNSSSGLVEGNLSLGNFQWITQGPSGWDPSTGRLFLVAGNTIHTNLSNQIVRTLVTIDVTSRSLLHEVPFPADGSFPIAFDSVGGMVLYGDAATGTLDELDPASGSSTTVAELPGQAYSLTVDSADRSVIVGTMSGNGTDEALVLGLTTFTVVADLYVPSICGVLVDPSSEVIYLSNCYSVAEVAGGSYRLLGVVNLGPFGWQGEWSLGPGPGELLLGQSLVDLNVMSVVIEYVAPYTLPGAAFQTVPLAGTYLPSVVGLVLVAAGAFVLVVGGSPEVRAILRTRREEEKATWAELTGQSDPGPEEDR